MATPNGKAPLPQYGSPSGVAFDPNLVNMQIPNTGALLPPIEYSSPPVGAAYNSSNGPRPGPKTGSGGKSVPPRRRGEPDYSPSMRPNSRVRPLPSLTSAEAKLRMIDAATGRVEVVAHALVSRSPAVYAHQRFTFKRSHAGTS